MLDVIAQVGEFLGESQFGFAAAQPLVGELAQRDVADEADEPRRLRRPAPCPRPVRTGTRAVLAPCLHFAADADDAGFAGALVPVHVRVVLGAIGRRHQHVRRSGRSPRRPVAEDALGRQAELLDAAAMVDDDDCIDRRVQQGTEFELGSRGVRGCCWAGGRRLGSWGRARLAVVLHEGANPKRMRSAGAP